VCQVFLFSFYGHLQVPVLHCINEVEQGYSQIETLITIVWALGLQNRGNNSCILDSPDIDYYHLLESNSNSMETSTLGNCE